MEKPPVGVPPCPAETGRYGRVHYRILAARDPRRLIDLHAKGALGRHLGSVDLLAQELRVVAIDLYFKIAPAQDDADTTGRLHVLNIAEQYAEEVVMDFLGKI